MSEPIGPTFNRDEVAQGIESYANDNFAEQDPVAAGFFGYLANKIGNFPNDTMHAVIVSSQLVNTGFDLQNGIDGSKNIDDEGEVFEPIDSPALGISKDQQVRFAQMLPGIFREIGQEELAESLEQDEIFQNQYGMRLELASQQGYEHERVRHALTSFDESKREILDYVRGVYDRFDWEHFSIGRDDVDDFFAILAPGLLCISKLPMPFRVLSEDDPENAALLNVIAGYNKMKLENIETGNVWLVQFTESIPADFATFIRDHVLINTIKGGLEMAGIGQDAVSEYYASHPDEMLDRAAARQYEFLYKNGYFAGSTDADGA